MNVAFILCFKFQSLKTYLLNTKIILLFVDSKATHLWLPFLFCYPPVASTPRCQYQHLIRFAQEYYVETQLIPNSRTLTGSHQFTPSNFLFYFFINLKR